MSLHHSVEERQNSATAHQRIVTGGENDPSVSKAITFLPAPPPPIAASLPSVNASSDTDLREFCKLQTCQPPAPRPSTD